MYKNYLFDLYGTLVDIHTDEESLVVWEKVSFFYGYYGASYTPEALKASYLAEVKKRQKVMCQEKQISHEAQPEIELAYVFQALFLQKGIQADFQLSTYAAQVFRVASTEYIRLYEGTKDLLKGLKEAGKKVYLLSNAQEIFTRYELRYLGIDALFDDIFISSEYGCKKPDAAFYNQPLMKYQLNPQETLMIGNDYTCDILGAQAVGLDTYYIHSNLSPETDLDRAIKSTYHLLTMDLQAVKQTLSRLK